MLLLRPGMVWIGFKYYLSLSSSAENTNVSPPTLLLQLHGALAFGFLMILGFVLHHIWPGWRQDKQRPSGLSFITICGVLILTGWGLYYVGDDYARNITIFIHCIIGGAFQLQENADAYVKTLQAGGFPDAQILDTTRRLKMVSIERFSSLSEASAALEKLKAVNNSAWIYAR